jgi:hypothetical protein
MTYELVLDHKLSKFGSVSSSFLLYKFQYTQLVNINLSY